MAAALAGLSLDRDAFISLLGKLIGETERLQNNPPSLIPSEGLAAQHVLSALEPYTVSSSLFDNLRD
jgi:acetylornithine deacetylase